jgi:hypothetical protein
MYVWRYDLGTWVEENVSLSQDHELPEGFEHYPFMTLGDITPQGRGMGVAVHEATAGSGYLVIVFAGDEALDPVVVSNFPSLIDLLAKLAPVVNASQK